VREFGLFLALILAFVSPAIALKVAGQLERAQLENITVNSNPGTRGRVFFNSTLGQMILDTGTTTVNVLANDGTAVFGLSATQSENVRFHRSGTNFLELVHGDDTTADGSQSSNLSALGADRIQVTDQSSTPSTPPAGRVGLHVKNGLLYKIDSSGVETVIAGGGGGVSTNLGIKYTSGTGVLELTGDDGNALSSSNVAVVSIGRTTTSNPGTRKTYFLNSPINIQDKNGTSEMINNLFGTPTGETWGQDIPFFIHICANDDEVTAMAFLSRDPSAKKAPIVTEIGDPSSAIADEELSFLSFEDITESEYDGNPCVNVGSIRMRHDSGDDITVQAFGVNDGIGKFQEGRAFDFPPAQFDAPTSTHFIPNGGTAPVFSTREYEYFIEKSGLVTIQTNFDGDGGADGASAVTAQVTLPLQPRGSNDTKYGGTCYIQDHSATFPEFRIVMVFLVFNQQYFELREREDNSFVQNGDFSAGTRSLFCQIQYYAFNNQ